MRACGEEASNLEPPSDLAQGPFGIKTQIVMHNPQNHGMEEEAVRRWAEDPPANHLAIIAIRATRHKCQITWRNTSGKSEPQEWRETKIGALTKEEATATRTKP